jgi:hypothetical protein
MTHPGLFVKSLIFRAVAQPQGLKKFELCGIVLLASLVFLFLQGRDFCIGHKPAKAKQSQKTKRSQSISTKAQSTKH